MITLKEILKNYKYEDLDPKIQDNINDLLEKINIIRKLWGKPMTVTSGFRSKEDQIRIYKSKGITDLKRIPMKSLHLSGEAIDIYDPGLELTKWLKKNPDILKDAGFWCEEGNSNWVHFQTRSPKSGKRWFLP